METTTIIEGTINITQPYDFCADRSRHMLQALKNKYIGKCWKGSYITEIVKIISSSECVLNKTNVSGYGYIDYKCEVRGTRIRLWDIMMPVTIESISPMIVGELAELDSSKPKNIHVTVSIPPTGRLDIQVGQVVPIRVIWAYHPPQAPQVVVTGVILTCDVKTPTYRIEGTLGPSQAASMKQTLAQIKQELLLRKELMATRSADFWFFETLLYSYKRAGAVGAVAGATLDTILSDEMPEWTGPVREQRDPQASRVDNILNIVNRAIGGETVPVTGYWTRSLGLYRSSPSVNFSDVSTGDTSIDGTPETIFNDFLKNIFDFIRAVREMVIYYNTAERIKAHTNVWTLMRANQLV